VFPEISGEPVREGEADSTVFRPVVRFLDAMIDFDVSNVSDLIAARRAYLERGEIHPSIRPVVLASWERSRRYGIDPCRLGRQKPDPAQLAVDRARNRLLLECAEPFLEQVDKALSEQAHLVALADAEGTVLTLLADPETNRIGLSSNLFEGASWHEKDIGCNGVGTCLAEGTAVVLIGPEHFSEAYADWTCLGFPLRRPDGKIMGALDLSVPTRYIHIHTWGWMISIARSIEHDLARRVAGRVDREVVLAELENPFNAMRGVLDLLAGQMNFAEIHRNLLERASRTLDLADRRLHSAVEQVLISKAELEKTIQNKDRFLSALAHELRNPLQAAEQALRSMRRAKHNPEKTAELGQVIQRQVSQALGVLNDLSDLTRTSRGKLLMKREIFDLRSRVRTALESLQPQIERWGHQVVLEEPDEPLMVHGDAIRLTQVFSNLLHNAVKFTKQAGNILLTLRRENNQATVRVKDDGIGLPPESLEDVFKPFVQLRQNSELSGRGLGIGLALARSFVDLHGGSIQVESAGLGQGSTFTVRLPLAAASGKTESPSDDSAGSVHRRLQVLVIDDSRPVAEGFAEMLEAMGHEVQATQDGREALDWLLSGMRPDVVFSDLSMPGMDGVELARRVRQSPELNDIVLVAVSAYDHEAIKRQALEGGFDHYLVKPPSEEDLTAILNRVGSDRD
jgi:signal transduction histidine kinase/CheY-like chemotaxis protein